MESEVMRENISTVKGDKEKRLIAAKERTILRNYTKI